jgi:sarcosine oxidase subunit beta
MPEVVVVGAGVVGASVAWHLRRLGVRDVLLLDGAAGPAQGSTGRATGGFRAQFGTEVNVRLSLLSREKLRRLEEETGVDPGYQPVGYLWLASSEEQLRMLREAQRVQHAAGLADARMLDAREIREVNPFLRAELAGAAFCPSDGYIKPTEILRGYLQGAAARFDSRVLGLERSGARIEAVKLADGSVIPAGVVVDAAGPWASEVARLAEVDLPVAPLRRQVAVTAETSALPPDMPMTIFVDDGFHLRVREGRVLLLWPTAGDPADPFSVQVEPEWIAQTRAKAAARIPALAGVPVEEQRCWAGLYEMSPDKHAIVGPAPGCENFYLCNGSSGHGVMHAPALGQILAEMIVHGAPRSLDVRALRPSRFAEGEPNAAPEIL